MKVAPAVGWLIGIAVGLAVFFTLGVAILFSVSYAAMHSNSHDLVIAALILGSWAGVIGACVWLASAVQRGITRSR